MPKDQLEAFTGRVFAIVGGVVVIVGVAGFVFG
jgi:hypothetical protein